MVFKVMTNNIKTIRSIPLELKVIPTNFAVRGEIFAFAGFEKMNQELMK
jgi:NAD-dependent DNA ligase